ncbi:hypothetical protein SAMN03097699_1682 [Flavobacteriaceae bacterium MAR_2010_188]|nr:hypothetical protein SAMN03097699_1682 [Flavobacteriaceae bacterium MAR_2010_188]
MKNFYPIYLILASLLFTSCMEEKKTEAETEADVEMEIPEIAVNDINESCYLYAMNNDSIALKYTIVEDKVSGKMHYNFSEKDSSFGNFEGSFEGDTLRGIYDFQSEGLRSTREIVFLKQGDELVNGSGKIIQNGNAETFDPKATLSFNSFKMQKVTCEDLKFDWEFTSN